MSFVCKDIEFEKQCLIETNRLRKLHGCPYLKINRKLNDYAKEWAQLLCDKGQCKHRKQTKYGENIYVGWGRDIKGKIPIKSWYNEIKNYNFSKGIYKECTRNFTQLIWKCTQEFGIAKVEKKCMVYVVAYYKTAGNFEDEFIRNVPPKIIPIGCTCISPFQLESLNQHNYFRKIHGSPPLKINQELCTAARLWAMKLSLSNSITMNHNPLYGENIFVTENYPVNGKTPVQCWYSEIKSYCFLKGKFNELTRHFTQVVWKSSTEFGIGKYKRKNLTWIVAFYTPAGNVKNKFIENVSEKVKSFA